MLYPSIQELLKATSKDGQERLNKYSITMATAKCARLITNEYLEERYNAEKKKRGRRIDLLIVAGPAGAGGAISTKR